MGNLFPANIFPNKAILVNHMSKKAPLFPSKYYVFTYSLQVPLKAVWGRISSVYR